MYYPVAPNEIVQRVEHIRDLLRQRESESVAEQLATERREQRLKDLISNLRRTGSRAMVQTLYELERHCFLTRDGSYRLFGYSLDAMREWDRLLNGGRTHLIEGYVYERDFPVELPLELASDATFQQDSLLSQLVLRWQDALPIRVLHRHRWRRPGMFYVHVGTEDSLGSSVPPGSTAMVERLSKEEVAQPNPRSVYLLQFRNGYRCCRCVLTRGRLQLFHSERSYAGPEEYPYPSDLVRVVGKVKSFAISLPLTNPEELRSLSTFRGNADLLLPWEHRSRSELFSTKYKRFVRSVGEQAHVQQQLQDALQTRMSERTRQRYRGSTISAPHADVLMQLTIESLARFSDTMRLGGYRLQDYRNNSLEVMLAASRLEDLNSLRKEAAVPSPTDVWEMRVQEIGEYSALFAMKFPRPSTIAHRVLRLGRNSSVGGADARMGTGSFLLMEEVTTLPDLERHQMMTGWSRPLYALQRGVQLVFGELLRDGSRFRLVPDAGEREPIAFTVSELGQLRRIAGAVVPL